MPTHAERKVVPYPPEQLYALVADVASYPEFLPWVISATVYNLRYTYGLNDLPIKDQTKNALQEKEQGDEALSGFDADLTIGHELVSYTYTSKVVLHPMLMRIDVSHVKGPFNRLNNHWVFHAHELGTEIEFFLEFELSNPLLKAVLQPFLNKAVGVMVTAFETRCKALYGG